MYIVFPWKDIARLKKTNKGPRHENDGVTMESLKVVNMVNMDNMDRVPGKGSRW